MSKHQYNVFTFKNRRKKTQNATGEVSNSTTARLEHPTVTKTRENNLKNNYTKKIEALK